MAITMASFAPEERKGGGAAGVAGASTHGPGSGPVSPHGDVGPPSAPMTAMHEAMPTTHPVTHTVMPHGTGAGQGAIHKGGRGGK